MRPLRPYPRRTATGTGNRRGVSITPAAGRLDVMTMGGPNRTPTLRTTCSARSAATSIDNTSSMKIGMSRRITWQCRRAWAASEAPENRSKIANNQRSLSGNSPSISACQSMLESSGRSPGMSIYFLLINKLHGVRYTPLIAHKAISIKVLAKTQQRKPARRKSRRKCLTVVFTVFAAIEKSNSAL